MLMHQIDQLISHMDDLEALGLELREYELEMARDDDNYTSGKKTVHSVVKDMMATMDKGRMFFSKQIEIIRKISPQAAEELDVVLDAYDSTKSIIEDELYKVSKESQRYMSEELIEYLEECMAELVDHYIEMRKTTAFAYSCFVGAVNFIISDDETEF